MIPPRDAVVSESCRRASCFCSCPPEQFSMSRSARCMFTVLGDCGKLTESDESNRNSEFQNAQVTIHNYTLRTQTS